MKSRTSKTPQRKGQGGSWLPRSPSGRWLTIHQLTRRISPATALNLSILSLKSCDVDVVYRLCQVRFFNIVRLLNCHLPGEQSLEIPHHRPSSFPHKQPDQRLESTSRKGRRSCTGKVLLPTENVAV